jgi:hypothetical protein
LPRGGPTQEEEEEEEEGKIKSQNGDLQFSLFFFIGCK